MFDRLRRRFRRPRREAGHAQSESERLQQQYEPRLLSRHGDVRAEDLWPTKLDEKPRR